MQKIQVEVTKLYKILLDRSMTQKDLYNLIIESNNGKSVSMYILNEIVNGKRKKLIYYQGIRAYSTPQFDIYLNFGPVIMQNQLYFQCRIDVFPFLNLPDSEKINKGWREHPMVEFWEVK